MRFQEGLKGTIKSVAKWELLPHHVTQALLYRPLSHKVNYSCSKLVRLQRHNSHLEMDFIFLRSLKRDRSAVLRTFY